MVYSFLSHTHTPSGVLLVWVVTAVDLGGLSLSLPLPPPLSLSLWLLLLLLLFLWLVFSLLYLEGPSY